VRIFRHDADALENRAAPGVVRRVKSRREPHVNTIFFKAIASVAIAAATIQPSIAQDRAAIVEPISIASCRVVPTYDPVLATEGGTSTSPTGESVWISFLNRSPRTVTEVTFLINSAQGPLTVSDQGRFSSGIPIEHALGPFTYVDDDATCGLYSARFDDGTVWQRP
jgi:hypothetical protein